MNNHPSSRSPIAVIGAGPVGLAAAAHAVQRGLPVLVFEAGEDVADNLGSYRQVRLFSPWRYNIDRAADEVQLELPETGVCSVDLAGPDDTAGAAACCGGPAKADTSACCVLDEVKKAEGDTGCGCGPKKAAPAAPATAPACCR